jgi:predicted ATPase/DNA-binding winged helix-turn-helix (wHTH) protein
VDDETFIFGSFRLVRAQRVLLDDGKPLRLGSRALDILTTLVEHAGETISKEQLIAHTWPDTVVDDGALRVHVAALRKALSDGRAGRRYVVNNPGRGYAFVAPVKREGHAPPATAPSNGASEGNNLPAPLTRIVGRDDVIAALSTQLARRRLLTIVGPGGIGKTTVAVAIAGAVRASYKDGVWFVGLASLSNPELVPSALGAALGMPPSGANPVQGLSAWLRDKTALIVLDSCEHVVGTAATLAEAVLKAAPGVSILTTSREPLRAEGETLHRLAALELPANSVDLTADDALRYSAIQLFNERARAAVDGFGVANADVPTVLEICRRLDGIPLALELAAARVGVFGLRDLAAHLDDRFHVLTSGRRTALPRHQTLGAALDWSYQLLPEEERAALRRLSVFAGSFTLEAAIAVADPGSFEIVDEIANLVGKSLVSADPRGEIPQYRLLDTTRLYAFEKLKSSGELQQVARRHAEYYLAVFANAEAESESQPQAEWLAVYGRHLDNVRAALDWAFSSEGDPHTGVGLTVAVVPLWEQMALLGECRERVERALAVLESGEAATARPRMLLSRALGWSLMYGVGRAQEAGPAWATTLELAERLDDRRYRLSALWSLCIDQFNNGDLRAALEFARRHADLAALSGDAIDLMMADRLLATAQHYFGDQQEARHHIDRALAQLATLALQHQIVRVRFDMRISTHYFQARILWLQGFAEQALRVVDRNIEEGNAIGQALSFCSVLGQGACPIAFWAGDLDAAGRYGAMLLDHTERHPIRLWHIWASCFNGLVVARRGDTGAGLQALRGGLEQAGDARFLPRFLLLLGELAACLGQAGEVASGLAIVEEMLARCEARDEGWYIADLLRIRGELILLEGAADAAAVAEQHFRRALDLAHRQDALFWELRTATSLARLWLDRHRAAEARALLGPVYGRFTEGFATADLLEAKCLLDQLA